MESIWDRTRENIREAFLQAAQSLEIGGYEAEQLCLSVISEFQEQVFVSGNLRYEFATNKEALTSESENDHRVAVHHHCFRQWMANSGFSDSLSPIIFRAVTEELQYQSDVYLRTRHLNSARIQLHNDEHERRIAYSA